MLVGMFKFTLKETFMMIIAFVLTCLLTMPFVQSVHITPTIQLTSAAFKQGKRIPVLYTGEGKDLSPQLSWKGISRSVKSIALICEDPDAPGGVWTHWIIYNIPSTVNHLNCGIAPKTTLSDGTRQGKNDFGKIGYGGPYPPKGHGTHHYFFKIYALNTVLMLPPKTTTRQVLLNAMKDYILAQGELMGTYSRN
jgi:Raf kinase inhibitor-like YbhB/YbcL family protein